MTKTRLETFTDGVIAIILTVMVLELKVPTGTDFAALRQIAPELVSYLLSFVLLGIYWNNHHQMFHSVEHVSGSVLWANLHLLFWLSLMPFGTKWVRDTGFVGAPVGCFGLILLMSGLAYLVLTMTLVAANGKNSPVAKALGADVKGKASVGIYLAAVLLSPWAPFVSCGMYVLVALIWFVPDRRFSPRRTEPELPHS